MRIGMGALVGGRVALPHASMIVTRQGSTHGPLRGACPRCGTPAWERMMHDAHGQALGYARCFDPLPPFVVTCDVGFSFELYADFGRTGCYRPFPDPQRNRIFLADLAEHAATLRAIFLDPRALDPSRAPVPITRALLEDLGALARRLEDRRRAHAAVEQFFVRCFVTMIAEGAGFLPDRVFARLLEEHWMRRPRTWKPGVESLWRTMHTGGTLLTGHHVLPGAQAR
jgi:hypothetical protein